MTKERGLGLQVVRIGYVTVNVSNLERARSFYEALTPLRVVARTTAPAQAFKALGLERGRFDGYLMDDGSAGAPTAIHLVEWKEPAPRGKPYDSFFHAGFPKFAFYVPDADELLAKMAAHGVKPANETIARRYVSFTDPDGIIISNPEWPGVRTPHMLHVMSGPTDLQRTIRFYRDVVGLEYWAKSVAPEPMAASHGPGADVVQWDSHCFRTYGDSRFTIDVSKITHPPQVGRPYADPLNLGITRVGLEVLDIDDAVAKLQPLLKDWTGTEAKLLGPIETWDFGPDVPKRRVAVLQDPDGMWLDLYEPERIFIDRAPTPSGYTTSTEAV